MTMAATLTSAMRDGAALVAWAEPNTAALLDSRMEAAVLRGLAGSVPPELAFAVPLLRYANTDLPAMPIIEALMDDVRHDHHVCDRCGNTELSVTDRLWVPCGAAVVEVAVCWRCKAEFDRTLQRSSLVWT